MLYDLCDQITYYSCSVNHHCQPASQLVSFASSEAMTATQLTVDGPSRGGKDPPSVALLVRL